MLLNLNVCTPHQLTKQLVTWLIDCYQKVEVHGPVRSLAQTPSIFTSLRNYQCQNQFIIPCTHRVGGWVKLFEFVLNSVSLQIPGLPGCHQLPSVVLHVVITWRVKRMDRKRSVLFPSKYKTESHLRLRAWGKIKFLCFALFFSVQ